MNKTILALAALAFVASSAFAHDQTLTNSASAGVSGAASNYANTSSSGNGFSASLSGNTTSGAATASSTVFKAPGFNSSNGTGTTGGTIAGGTTVNTTGFAANVSVGGGAGNAGEVGNVAAVADASYNSLNNYVPLAVKQIGHADSSAGQVAEVGSNGVAGATAGSSNEFAGAGFATRLVGGLVVAGAVTDTKAATSYSLEGGLGNVVNLSNGTIAHTSASGCFKAATVGTLGGC